jgi:hypothetical protein
LVISAARVQVTERSPLLPQKAAVRCANQLRLARHKFTGELVRESRHVPVSGCGPFVEIEPTLWYMPTIAILENGQYPGAAKTSRMRRFLNNGYQESSAAGRR